MVVVIGLLCFGLASVALGVSPSYLPLLPARAVQGLGGGLLLGAGLQAAFRLNPVRHEALIAFNSAFLLGGALGAPAGGYLAGLLPGLDGYRITFGICALLAFVVALCARWALPLLPPALGAGQPTIGWPRLVWAPGLGPALVLGTLGDFLRGGVVYTALPLAGQARHLSTATIGVAVGLLLAVEIITVRNAGPLLGRFGVARGMVAALSVGVVLTLVLAMASGRPAFVACAFGFGVVIAAATVIPPLILVSLNGEDAAAGLASFRVSSGIGMLVGSTGAGAAVVILGPKVVFLAIGGVLLVGVVLARRIGRHLPAPAAA
jgi:MFS family permease